MAQGHLDHDGSTQVTTLHAGSGDGGTAVGVFPASWNVAAKTGTAEVGSFGLNPLYTSDWMIAFVPGSHVVVALVAPFQASSATGAVISGPPTCARSSRRCPGNSTEACPGA